MKTDTTTLTHELLCVWRRWQRALGLVPLPLSYWPLLATILLCYMVLTQLVKTWFIRRYAID